MIYQHYYGQTLLCVAHVLKYHFENAMDQHQDIPNWPASGLNSLIRPKIHVKLLCPFFSYPKSPKSLICR